VATHARNMFTFTSADVSATPFTTDQIRPYKARWVGPANAAGNQVIFTDVNGNPVVQFVATGAYFETDDDKFDEHDNFNGLVIKQLDAGTVYLEHR
jgi:hypothetical protein